MIATRQAYGKALAELGDAIPNLVVLEADISKSTCSCYFAERHPSRFFNFGVAEQNMLAAAAGLAASGFLPVANTYAVFASMRAIEQFRTCVAYPHLNVSLAASHGGLSTGVDGPTHQGIEDLAIMRAIPGTLIVQPADEVATRKLLAPLIRHAGPTYLRLLKNPTPRLYPEDAELTLGRAELLREGRDVALIASGFMVHLALEAAERLARRGVEARVLDIHTLKPLDEQSIVKAARECGAIVSAEDHIIFGGLGSAVAEVVSEKEPVPLARIGLRDVFGESGHWSELFEKYGLSVAHIEAAMLEITKHKEHQVNAYSA